MPKLKQFFTVGNFKVTDNKKERTYTIYDENEQFLSTVNYGELNSEIQELENERAEGAD